MILIHLYLFVSVNLFLYAKCFIPEDLLCVNEACDKPISEVVGKIHYIPSKEGVLSFEKGNIFNITSKPANTSEQTTCEYWGAIIKDRKGYVPSCFVQERKVYHSKAELIPVNASLPVQSISFERNASTSDKKIETEKLSAQMVQSNPNDVNNLSTDKKEIKPTQPTFTVVEGTTIYADEPHEIQPSIAVDGKSTHTAVPVNAEVNKNQPQQLERATIPPEVINLNSNFDGQKRAGNFKIEKAKGDDENAKIESKDIYIDENEIDDEEDDEEEDDEGEDEEEDDGVIDELNNVAESPILSKIAAENLVQNATIDSGPQAGGIISEKAQQSEGGMIAGGSGTILGSPAVTEATKIEEKIPAGSATTIPTIPKSIAQVAAASSALPQTGFEAKSEPVLRNMGKVMAETSTVSGAAAQSLPKGAVAYVGLPPNSLGPNSQPIQQNMEQIMAGASTATHSPTISETTQTGTVASDIPQPTVGVISEKKERDKKLNTAGSGTTSVPEATTQNATPGFALPQKGFEAKSEPVLQNMGEIMAETSTAIPQSVAIPGAAAQNLPKGTAAYAGVPPNSHGPNGQPIQQNMRQMAEIAPATPQSPTVSGKTTQTASGFPQATVGVMGENNQQNVGTAKSSQTVSDVLQQKSFSPSGENIRQTTHSMAVETVSTTISKEQTASGVTPQASLGVNAETTMQNIQNVAELPVATPESTTAAPKNVEEVTEPVEQVFSNAGSQIPDSEKPDETVVEKTSTVFSEFSVLPDSLPKDTANFEKPMEEKLEVTSEAYGTTYPSETGNSVTMEVDDVTPEKLEITTEASIPNEMLSEDSLPKDGVIDSPENTAEGPGMLSQITGMFSSWFTSAPVEEVTEGKPNYEAFQDFTGKTEGKSESFSEAPLGACHESGFDCKDFPSAEEQHSFWTDLIPAGFGLDAILTQSNTVVYLIVTAVTVLLFTLGHNFIEKRGKTGPLIAKINKLEHELLVTSKECVLLKEEVQSTREKISLYENSANDELVISLQSELEESKKARAELESSIEILQQELDAATEAGLDLNKMLSEVLTQKGGSETLLKSVESLQAQLDSQQKVIDEMTKKLGVKNQENEALQLALQSANDRSENLEEQLTDIKHNLNLHLKEKEDVTRDLNARINQLMTCSNQLWETKEEEANKFKAQLEEMQKKLTEVSNALTVKEEEVKALKESMKHLKGKGDVKLDTVFDFSRMKAELAKEVKENQALLETLQKEESNRMVLAEKVNGLESEAQKLKKNYEEAEQKKDEAEKKLEVLSTYFKEKETQLQKELGLQEALWAQKKGDENAVCNMMKSLQEEVESYKSQNETLKKEILDQERGLKNQIAGLEQKAHENWVAARQAERKLEEAKQEMAQLRNKLVSVVEKSNSNVEGRGVRSPEELNGVEAASPILHDTSSPLLFPPFPLDPNNSNLLPPGFMPPPMFMPPPIGGFMPPPPFLPGDRRPPPLGRMSSPPLNNRSSPADYPFERMSSPPLSPPGSSHRSLNDDREHYRHRPPALPPPLHPRNWDDGADVPGFIPISSQRDSRRDLRGSNVSSEHSSSESLDKSSRHSGRV